MTTEVYRAVVGDFYWLWVNDHGEEFFRRRDAAPGLRPGADVLEVMVEAIEADGTVVETTWTGDRYLHFVSWDGSRFSPVQPRGQGWFEDHRPKGHGSTADSARPRSVAWLEDGVLTWQDAQIAKRDGRRAKCSDRPWNRRRSPVSDPAGLERCVTRGSAAAGDWHE